MAAPYYVSLIPNGQNQILTIPYHLTLPSIEVILRKEGDRLIIEPLHSLSLLSLLSELEDIREDFSDVDEGLLPLDDITI